jgi:hypothetical protein
MKTTCIAYLVAVLALAPGVLHAQAAPALHVTGTMNVVWGDPKPGAGAGGAIYTVEGLDRANLPPQFAGKARLSLRMNGKENVAAYYLGKRVSISGNIAANLPEAVPAADVDVVTIGLAQTPNLRPQVEASVSGTKKVIFLLAKFSDDTAVPHTPTFYTDLANPATPPVGEPFSTTINGFFSKTSYNKFSWSADVGGVGGVGASGGWLTLPHPKSFYAPCGWGGSCAAGNLAALGDDATALGRAQGIVFTNYDNVNFVLSNDLDCCSWGGGYYSSVDNKTYGATWEPPWGQETSTYSHEMGHSIGLPHSGWVYSAYDSPWDTMSNRTAASSTICGTYVSVNDNRTDNIGCYEPGDGYIAAHLEYLGWIAPANETVVNPGTSATVTLEAVSLALGANMKMIKICLPALPCSGSTAHYMTVEARVNDQASSSQYDNAIPGNGIIIHDVLLNRAAISGTCFFNNQSGWAVPIDSTPGDYDSVNCNTGVRTYPNYALFNAQYTAGQTYTNSTYGVSVTVGAKSGSTWSISVVSGKKRRGQLTTAP